MIFQFIIISLLIKHFLKKEWDFSLLAAGLVGFSIHIFTNFNSYYYTPFPPLITFTTIVAGIYFWGSDRRRIKIWLENEYNNQIDTAKALLSFAEDTKKFYTYTHSNIPLGRANAFIDGFESLDQKDYIDIDYLGYNPVRSKELMELREYGMLMTNKGIFLKHQKVIITKDNETNKKKTEYHCEPIFIPFSGLWSIKIYSEKKLIIFKFSDCTKISINLAQYPLKEEILYEVEKLVGSGVTSNLLFENDALNVSERQVKSASSQIQDAYESLINKNLIGLGSYQGFLASQTVYNKSSSLVKKAGEQMSSVSKRMEDIQLNKMKTHTGHGEAAEYANNTYDKLNPMYSKIKDTGNGYSNKEASGQGVNAVDRQRYNNFTGQTERIQTKYFSSAKGSADSYLKGGYSDDIILEVPPEQFAEVKEFLIENGKSDVKVVKGRVSYKNSHAVAEAGNIHSIKVDLLDGAIQSVTGASISFIITYAQARHLGLDRKDATKRATATGLSTLGTGAILYAGSHQFAKTKLASELASGLSKSLGRQIDATKIAGYAGSVITVGIVYGPSVVDALRGRISPQQLAKNATIGTVGLVSGAVGAKVGGKVGGTLGTVAGPVGSIGGAMAGSYVTKRVIDKYIEDDSSECFEIFREEFIDYLYQIEINQNELEELINLTFTHTKFNGKLKDIYKSGRKYKGTEKESIQRDYINDKILEPALISIIQKREVITEAEIEEAYNFGSSLMVESNIQVA